MKAIARLMVVMFLVGLPFSEASADIYSKIFAPIIKESKADLNNRIKSTPVPRNERGSLRLLASAARAKVVSDARVVLLTRVYNETHSNRDLRKLNAAERKAERKNERLIRLAQKANVPVNFLELAKKFPLGSVSAGVFNANLVTFKDGICGVLGEGCVSPS